MYAQILLVTSVRGSGVDPMIAASGPVGVSGFMNAAFGLRALFFFAAFFGAALLATFFMTFLAAAFFADFFAFLAVAINDLLSANQKAQRQRSCVDPNQRRALSLREANTMPLATRIKCFQRAAWARPTHWRRFSEGSGPIGCNPDGRRALAGLQDVGQLDSYSPHIVASMPAQPHGQSCTSRCGTLRWTGCRSVSVLGSPGRVAAGASAEC